MKTFFGLELHVELATKTKLFSNTENNLNQLPNTKISNYDLGYPGVKPQINKKAISFIYQLAKNLEMNIFPIQFFDRKNYLYPDLSKGFQITQYFQPFAKNGIFIFFTNEKMEKEIKITHIQLEEDTAKRNLINNDSFWDFNRSGIALIEIITDFNQLSEVDDVVSFVEQFRQFVKSQKISNANLSEGTIRVDVNLSLSKTNDAPKWKVEIKNLNSLENMKNALKYEIDDLKKKIERNIEIISCTKKYDEINKKTIFMRNKNSMIEYNFFVETNVHPIKLDFSLLDIDYKNNKYFNLYEFRKQKLNYFKNEEIDKIINNSLYLNFLSQSFENNNLNKDVYSNLLSYFFPIFETNSKLWEIVNYEYINTFSQLLAQKKITKDFLKAKMLTIKNIDDIKLIISELESNKIDSKNIRNIVEEVISNNKNIGNVNKYKKFLLGEIAKLTKGSVNMKEVNQIINELVIDE